jgi:hypothetical protein
MTKRFDEPGSDELLQRIRGAFDRVTRLFREALNRERDEERRTRRAPEIDD